MKRLLCSLTCLAALALGACGSEQPPPAAKALPAPAIQAPAQPTDADLGAAIRKALGGDWEARYFSAAVDLNGDGKKEVVAHAAGPMVCGTGGCPTFVFTADPEGYRLVAGISVAQVPVLVSSNTSQGWRNLVVRIAGGGIKAGYSELIIPEFQSYKDGKPVPAGPANP